MSQVHPLELNCSVLDPLHGLVRLTDEEQKIIDHPLYQRMRSIRQNGLLHLVFPGAVHTRFIHSIGAMHVADSLLQALVHNTKTGRDKGAIRGDCPRPKEAEVMPEGVDLQQIFRVTRIALLIHDLGHGPFSHGFDPFAPRIHQIKRIFAEEKGIAFLKPIEDNICYYDTKKGADVDAKPIAHEAMSCLLFARIGRECDLPEPLILAVCAALVASEIEIEIELAPPFDPLLLRWLPLIGAIASSSPIDADRMDYMLRDSRACGVTYGVYDLNRILKTALCYREDTKKTKQRAQTKPRVRLGWKRSGLRAVENFVQARFQLYAQIYHHKTNRAFNQMLTTIGSHAKAAELNLFARQRTLEQISGRYRELSDDARFLRILCEGEQEELGVPSQGGALPAIQELAERIQARDPWVRVFESTPGMDLKAAKRALADRGEKYAFADDTIKLRATKGLDQGAPLLVRGSEGFYEVVEGESGLGTWLDASPILRALHREPQVGRLYYTGSGPKMEREKEITRLRQLLA